MATIFWTHAHAVARQLTEGEDGRLCIAIDPAEPHVGQEFTMTGNFDAARNGKYIIIDIVTDQPREHDARCKGATWSECTCAELRFVDGIDRDIQALYDHWDTEKACARDRKYYEYGPNGVFDFNHGNGPPPSPTTADHLASAFALSAPAESERQEYLAPYRMREGFGG